MTPDARTLSVTRRTAGIRTLTKVAEGSAIEELFSEGDTSLAFEQLASEARDADAKAAENLVDARQRSLARWARAVYRDALYAHAGRKHAMGLGLHGALRSLYEGGKTEKECELA